ncbi:MAG: hypothetical protein HY594_05165 [Candidatus Omnitrophica bacterium]|nr:hypothetical protein [Candidatus Omnitrophota bacterium]
MNRWDDLVREEHRILRALAEELQREQQRAPAALETHLQGEEEILFPAMARLLGDDANALRLLRDHNQGLREEVRQRVDITQMLDEHEQRVQRLLIDVLEFR